MSEQNPTTSNNMGKENQKSSNFSLKGKNSEAPPSVDQSKEQTEKCTKKSETADRSSCLNLPEFLNKTSQPEFEGVNPRQRRQSELILPAVGLERTTPMTVQQNFTNPSSSSSSLLLSSDSDRESIVTEKIKDPDQLLDTIRAALLTSKNVNRNNVSTTNNNNNLYNDNNTSTEASSSNLKEHVDKIILYRNLIDQLSHHHHFRKPTDLLRLHELPKSYGLECEIWIKCEFQHFSGSSKYRVASLMLAELELIQNSSNNSTNNSDHHHPSSSSSSLKPSTIITHTSASFTLALACAKVHMGKNYQIISILPDRTSKLKRTLLQSMGVKIYRSPEESSDNSLSNESPTIMAKFLSEKIKNSIVLNPFQHPLSLQTHYLWTGREIVEQFNSLAEKKDENITDIDMLVCGYETGGMISGLSPLFKDTNENCIIIGVDLSGQLQNNNDKKNNKEEKGEEVKYQNPIDPDTIFIEEYSSPSLCPLLNVKVADKWYHISLKDATNMARTMMLNEGIPVTATSGAVLQAAITAAKEFNLDSKKDSKILLVIDNFALYTDFELGSNEWMVSRGYMTNLEIEATKWYHLIHCWRIPVKVPVTVFNDFNASAVYQMMKTDGIDRVIVQDATTNAILGVSTLTNLETKLQDGSLIDGDLIGDKMTVCTSFQTICINNTISTLFELFKTKSWAILVQRQKFISATRGRLDQDWISGILNIQDLVRFISDIEKRHGEKFGANLCGGFYRAKSTNTNNNTITDIDKNEDITVKENESKSYNYSKSIEEYSNDKKYQEKNSTFMKNKPEDLVIGSHLKEAIINVMITTDDTSDECSNSMMEIPPPDMTSLDFSYSTTPDPEPESTTEIIVTTAENGTDNVYQQGQGSVQTEARRLTAEAAQVSSSGFSTPASFTFDHDSLILTQETNTHNFYTPTRYHSMHQLENEENSSTSDDRENGTADITLSEELNSDTYLPIGLEYSTMTLGDSLLSAWYSTTMNEPITTSDPGSHSSNVLLAVDNPISSDNSSDVLLSIQSLPQIRVFNQFQSNIETDQEQQQQQQQSPQSQNVLNSTVSITPLETIPDRNGIEILNSMESEDGGNSNTIVIPTREQEEFIAPVLSEQCDPILNESVLNALPLAGNSLEAAAAEAQAMKFPGQNRIRKIKEESTTVIKTIQSVYRLSKELDGSTSINTNTATTNNLITTPNITKAVNDSRSLDNTKSKNNFQDSTSPTSTTNITTSVTTNSSK